MRHVVIASHHRFASGLRDTLEFIGGDLGIVDINAYIDDAPLEDQVRTTFDSFAPEDEVLVFTDMMQGSVNQAFIPYIGPNVFLVTGVNVPCALELALSASPLTGEDVAAAIDAARSQLMFVNAQAVPVDDEDE